MRTGTTSLENAIARCNVPVRRNVPITTTRSAYAKRPGNAWPSRRFGSTCRSIEMLFRRRRQRDGLVCQRGQISNHVGALAVFLNTRKAHRSTGNKTLRVGDEFVEVVKRPFAALRFHGGGEI